MKKFIATAFAAVAMSTSASADVFFQRTEKLWSVFGVNNVKDKNPACIAEQTWKDGSYIQLIKDLADDELYLAFTNMEWQIQDDPGTYKMRVNATVGSEIYGFTFDYNLQPKNTIIIRGIISDKFVPIFATATQLKFVMPGTITNATIYLNGSRAAVDALSDCVTKYKSSGLSSSPKKGLNL